MRKPDGPQIDHASREVSNDREAFIPPQVLALGRDAYNNLVFEMSDDFSADRVVGLQKSFLANTKSVASRPDFQNFNTMPAETRPLLLFVKSRK